MRRLYHWACLVVIVLVVPLITGAAPVAAQDTPFPATAAYVPPMALGGFILRPQSIIGYPTYPSPSIRMMPVEVAEAWGMEYLGVNPLAVAEIKVIIGMPTGPQPPQVGLVITMLEDFDPANISADLLQPSGPLEVQGRQIYPLRIPDSEIEMMIDMVDARTALIGDRLMLQAMRNAPNGLGPLADLLTQNPIGTAHLQFAVAIQPLRPLISQIADNPPPDAPEEVQDLVKSIVLINSIVARVKWDGSAALTRLEVLADGPAEAANLHRATERAIDYGKTQALAQIEAMIAQNEPGPINDALQAYFIRMVDEFSGKYRPKLNADRVVVDYRADMSFATTGVLVGLLLPAVQSARNAAQRMSSSNNMKQIALAMHNYHDTYNRLPPPAITSDTGEPLLSWRVALLPYLEGGELYDRFKLDEPWDSDHNIALLAEMPSSYADPGLSLEPGLTIYHAMVGDRFMFHPTTKSSFRDVTDGLSNTIMAIAGNQFSATPWTSPDYLEIDSENPTELFDRPTGFLAAMGDGSVVTISAEVDNDQINAALTRDGQEPIGVR